ncbi:ParB family protein [Endozoicomonas sp. ALC066]|uniref:ParB family protein n=1 Tax=Endozoicomonas sp. ALC066 TaxID=3403078 RepID=UPI003BB4BD48
MAKKTIGRKFKPQSAPDLSEREITLPDGRVILFSAVHVAADDLEDQTFVNQSTNYRDQEMLTMESVSQIRETIKTHQWFPAIGIYNREGLIEVLDGSRRRYSALLEHVGLDMLVADEDSGLTEADAKSISLQIQTAREHSIRDLGMRLLPLWNAVGGELKQAEIARQENLSIAKVGRALTAARVPSDLVKLFPDPNELSHPDYKKLLKVSEQLELKKIELSDLVTTISALRDIKLEECGDALKSDETKETILDMIQDRCDLLIKRPLPKKVTVSKLLEFTEKDKFARKRVKGSQFFYEFSRLGRDVQKDIDAAINAVLEKHYQVHGE